ncbi:DUF305 domain-containing protein [Micromonospora sp. RTGN7]|uniref:DUF305 domain-containing protein n=1 Tax=Micromonospora sp. RTGN7 TaxID=3016526 RepID=UPI0029FEC828|nr:DUF305 domain-containing protein [Micromonospora sp. RTGN7]
MTVTPPRRPRNRPAKVSVLLVGLLLAALPATTGCRAEPSAAPSAQSAPGGSTAQPAPGGTTAATTLGGTDAAWLQLMIPMNEQVLKALDLAPGRSADTGVQRAVERISAARRAELDDLRRLRDGVGLPTANAHEGHDLPGMVIPADLVTLGSLRGPAFDRAIEQTLREHVEQGARLAESEQANGSDPGTRQLAERMGRTRATELDWLRPAPATSSG